MSEIRALTGLRGIAALIVFFAHMRETLAAQGLYLDVPDMVRRLILSGGRQVDIFFVLSGFILAMTYRTWFAEAVSSGPYFKFLRRRFARIYPLHFVMLVLVLSFVLAAKFMNVSTHYGLERFSFDTLPAHFLLVHAWGFLAGPGEWNPPSWSISIEALAYLIFPFLIWGTARWAKQSPWLLVIIALIIGFTLNYMTHWGLDGFAGIARGVSEFTLGCLTMNLYGSRFAAWLQTGVGSMAAVLGLLVAFAITPDTGFIIAVATAPLLLSFCAKNVVSNAVSAQPIYFLGEISYSIYLGHFLFSSIAYRLVSIQWMKTGALPTAIGIICIAAFVIALSTLTYYTIERPARDLLSDRRKKPATVQVSVAPGA